jgi:hypothetical protein
MTKADHTEFYSSRENLVPNHDTMNRTLLTRTSEMSLTLNFLTEISIIEGNPQTLPQIRIDDVEADICLNVTAIICPNLRASL